MYYRMIFTVVYHEESSCHILWRTGKIRNIQLLVYEHGNLQIVRMIRKEFVIFPKHSL